MRSEYKDTHGEMCIMLKKHEIASIRRLLKAKELTQSEFVRCAYVLCKAGYFERIDEIKKNNN